MMNASLVNPSAARSAADEADRGEQLSRLGEVLGQLGERERLALHLYYLDADPITAAQEALGLSRSGFYKLLHRARERLGVLMHEVQPS